MTFRKDVARTRRLAVLGVILSVGVTGFSVAPASAAPTSRSVSVAGASLQEWEITSSIVGEINRVRADHGIRPLRQSARLSRAARGQNSGMARIASLTHDVPGAGSLGNRVRASGYDYRRVAENVGMTTDVSEAGARELLALMLDPAGSGHRENILGSRYSAVGVDVRITDGTLWMTHIFAAPRR